MKHNTADLQVPVYFLHAHRCYFHVLFTDELGQRLFRLKIRNLQKGKTLFDTKIGVLVRINQ